MTEEDLVERHPLLWHMAEDGSWPGIREHGLLSTAALLDLYQVGGEQRTQIVSRRRPRSVAIKRAELPDAVVRDQKPMNDDALAKCLKDGITPERWYEILNAKTFFWVSRSRLDKLLQARAYRGKPQVVLTVLTRSLVETNRDRILLSPINSGATLYIPQARGLDTFRSMADFPYDDIRKQRSGRDPIVELVVEGGVPDVAAHVMMVERVVGAMSTIIWEQQVS
jgi:hypothetical protein